MEFDEDGKLIVPELILEDLENEKEVKEKTDKKFVRNFRKSKVYR